MGELWRKASETLWARPLLWVPVLLADLLGSGINIGQQALVRAVMLSHSEYRSVMGGPAQRVPLTAATMARTAEFAIPVAWCSYFLRILLYVVALAVTAGLVAEMMTRAKSEGGLMKMLRERFGRIFAVTLRLLAVYGVMALVFSTMSQRLEHQGHHAVVMSPWFRAAGTLLLTLLLVAVAAGPALRLASGGDVRVEGEKKAQYLGLILAVVSLALGSFVGQSARGLMAASVGTRLTLEIVGSLLSAVPFVLLFVVYGVLGKEEADARELASYDAQASD